MIRGLNLALAALVVVSLGVGSVFAFTPSIGGVPDIIIGDRTPGNTSAANDLPSDPFTHAQSLEGLSAIANNVYDFPNAVNIFSYVSDEPNGVAGFTSDNLLVYEFVSTPVFPVTALPNTPINNRISINGTRITTSGYTTVTVTSTGLLSFKDEAMSADADNNANPGSNPAFTYLFSNSAGSENVSTGTVTPDGTVTVLDQVAMTMRVTNQNSGVATDSFFVTTVEEGPDATSGLIVGPPTTQDLSGWAYLGIGGAGAFGPTFTGDTQITGQAVADNDADGSVSDLRLNAGDTTGDFYQNWTSPAAIIPFTQDGTYHLRWNVSSTIASAAANPTVRFRWAYTNAATLGGGDTVAPTGVAAPATGGTDYVTMFDHLNVAAETSSITVPPNDIENTVRLFFENYDLLQSGVGGGQTELNSLEITSVNRAALLAVNTVERAVTDYSTTTQIADSGINFASAPITYARTTTNVTITAPVAQSPGSIADAFGNATNYMFDYFGPGMVPFAPSSTNGRIYRVSATVDSTANSTTTYLPRVDVVASTHDVGNSQLFTVTTNVNPVAQGGGFHENPAYNGVNSYAAYLALPSGTDLSGANLGGSVRVAGSVKVFDNDATQGGSLTVTGLQVTSFPEALLP